MMTENKSKCGKVGEAEMALMLYLDDAMKVLLQHGFIDDGYIDEDGKAEVVRNELEQKCYLREPVELVRCRDCKYYTANVFKNNGFNYGECHKLAIGLGVYAVEDWFCADGVKKDD